MKRQKIFMSIAALVILFTLKGCITDDFDTLTQNVPVSKEFTITGTGPSVSREESFCLDDSKTIQDYRDKIKKIEIVTATYKTNTISPTNVTGDITISLAKQDGTLLYSYTMKNVTPANYISTPYVLEFSQSQLALINAYLATLKAGACFKATISVTNITPSATTITLNGKIDIAFKMEADT